MPTPPFSRTTCACRTCVQSCYRQPGPLAPGDLERIAEYLGLTIEEAKKHFWASPGGMMMVNNRVHRVGTVTPKRRRGKCVFLDDDDRCRIHPVATAGCALFDTHMPTELAKERGVWLMTAQMEDAQYQALRDELPYAQSYRPSPY